MKAAIRRIERSISNLLTRATVTALNTASKCQTLQVELMPGEPKENVEHLEPYGFTSAPLNGAEGAALFPDGDRGHGMILVVADRRYRLKGLQAGEVAIYTDEGDSITLKRGNTIHMQTKNYVIDTENYTANISGDCTINADGSYTVNAPEKITLNTALVESSADMKAGGDVSDKTSTIQSLRETFNGHDHEYDDGTTDKPNQQM